MFYVSSVLKEAETGLARRLVMAPITYLAGMVGLGGGGGGGQYANRCDDSSSLCS